MSSIQASIVNQLLILTGAKTFFARPEKVPGKIAKLRKKGPDTPSKAFKKRYGVSVTHEDGFAVYTVGRKTPDTSVKSHVLYLHGGGYVMDMAWAHWNFIGRLIDATGMTVTAPIYPLAPEHSCSDLLPAMQSLFRRLADDKGASHITVMGDSAGGGLSLALAHRLRDMDQLKPKNLVLLSPWLDVEASDPSQIALEKKDRMIALSALRGFGDLYAGELKTNDPQVSPLYGNHQGLPPIQIFTGTADTLYPDAVRLKTRAAAANLKIKYHEYENMFHVWMLLPIPEGKQALREIAEFLTADTA